ncbi:MarR family winged helix-turn-helix transcriptional regulator [Gracilibacillus dipsosauri]|uniref:MarR family transcriptional regulator n=1 Tax=Gracilibacillus dipsosauri TaxID=178340 RepID=A0A317L7S9_9BACI|nr:MarR family transcriptional regulator [Gracilibacillus dipsosauri]PWU69839.1 MarR family transcriptional regulator [Gracilibacillus dipsosauri]
MSTVNHHSEQQDSMHLGKEFSLALIMFHQTAAEKVGLNLTDYKVLGLIPSEGMTAGEIASKTGLSTGMVTTVVDRLARKGFVFRERPTEDRRKVIIKANVKKVGSELGAVFQSFGQEMGKVVANYSPEEIKVINDYIEKSMEVFKQEIEKMK